MVLIVLLVIGVLAGGAAFAINRMIEEGARAMREASQPRTSRPSREAETVDDGLTVEYQGKTYRYNENVVSIVVMGYDRRQDVSVTGKASQADAIMVVALDTSTGLMRVIGVPRDTMVDVDENVGDAFIGQDKMQIALAFSYGDGYESSAENVVRAVSRVLYNMPMNYYLALNMEGVGPINDAVGRVASRRSPRFPNTGIYEGSTMTLYGTNATKYVQYRDTSQLDSSLQRQAPVPVPAGVLLAGHLQRGGQPDRARGPLPDRAAVLHHQPGPRRVQLPRHGAAEPRHEPARRRDAGRRAREGRAVREYHLDQQSVYETVLDVFYTPVEDEAEAPAE